MCRSILLSVVAVALLSHSVASDGIENLRSLELPATYCDRERILCTYDDVCSECLTTTTIPDAPDVDASSFDCDTLNEWFAGIEFESSDCNLYDPESDLSAYVYCLFDTYKKAAGIAECIATTPLATAAPADTPCAQEKSKCEKDATCSECLLTTYIPELAAEYDCEDLNSWFLDIEFESSECNLYDPESDLSFYLYCLFDTYKALAEIDVCVITTEEVTAAPTPTPCDTEMTNCENDKTCYDCISTVWYPGTPDENYTCAKLNDWFWGIDFDSSLCNVDIVPQLSNYIYCLYDTYRIAAGIDDCKTTYTFEPTSAPTDASSTSSSS